ncbi:MAG: polyprenyl synthetase [Planctomycetes bacterium]|nr:polyprenyl synthetase [Planctomycetota bacterium]
MNSCPSTKQLRDRLRAMVSDCVASWRAEGIPPAIRTPAGLRDQAERIVRRAGAGVDAVGWTMVALVSEHWRDRLGSIPSGRRLVLLPDCPVAPEAGGSPGVPKVCGPSCGIATIWAAARDHGWVVEPTSTGVAAIGSLLTGQYDGVLGVARLADLERAFAMLPAFALPIAAVPYADSGEARSGGCAESLAAAALDVEWVLRLLGVAGGDAAPVGDYLPLLREAAGMFEPAAITRLLVDHGLQDGVGGVDAGGGWAPLEAAAGMSVDFLARGGKFLRPFVTLAAFDAVTADLADAAGRPAVGLVSDPAATRPSAKAAAVAIEIFHKASLVHDDIEDGDAARYGRATLHEEVGVASALNAGDYLLGLGYRIMAGLPGLDATAIRDAVAILADAHVRLAKGQGAELWWRDGAGRGGDIERLSPHEALEIYGLKTSPAFEAAVALGVRLAGGDPRTAAPLGRYARHVGTGFQVLNDLKDWAGDLENDRRAAGDLIGGRPTVLWALAMETLPAVDRARLVGLAAVARSGTADVASAVAEARRLYEKARVVDRALALAADQRRLAAEAVSACRMRRLREVLEFLLDLAVPAGSSAGR